MQSAARVPILISFEVEGYAGPDKDVILEDVSYVDKVLQDTMKVAPEEIKWSSRGSKSESGLVQNRGQASNFVPDASSILEEDEET